jgi:hypothetical protein
MPQGGTGDPADDRARLWFSEDLMEWSQRSLPVDARFATFAGADGQYWLTAADPANSVSPVSSTLWRSDDVQTWQETDLGDLVVTDGPPEAEWAISLSPLVVSDDANVAPYTVRLANAGQLLGLTEESGPFLSLTATDGGDYQIKGPYDSEVRGLDGQVVPSVRFEETADGLRVVDAEDGTELNTVDGMGMDFIDRWAAGSNRTRKKEKSRCRS